MAWPCPAAWPSRNDGAALLAILSDYFLNIALPASPRDSRQAIQTRRDIGQRQRSAIQEFFPGCCVGTHAGFGVNRVPRAEGPVADVESLLILRGEF